MKIEQLENTTSSIDPTSTRIVVEDLPLSVNEKWLEKLLQKYGEMDGFIVRYPPPPKRPFAFIDFENATAAAKAILGLNKNGYDGVQVVAYESHKLNDYDRVTITPHRVALEALPSLMTQREVLDWIENEGKSDATHVEVDGCGNGIAYFITHAAMETAIGALDRTILDNHPVRLYPEDVHTTQSILTTSIANSGQQSPSTRTENHAPTAVFSKDSSQHPRPEAHHHARSRPIKQEQRARDRSRSISRSRSPYHHRPRDRFTSRTSRRSSHRYHDRSRSRSPYWRRARTRSRSWSR